MRAMETPRKRFAPGRRISSAQVDTLVAEAAELFGVTPESVREKDRRPRVCRARWWVIQQLAASGRHGTPEIGKAVGGITPSSVRYALAQEADPDTAPPLTPRRPRRSRSAPRQTRPDDELRRNVVHCFMRLGGTAVQLAYHWGVPSARTVRRWLNQHLQGR